jgi:predicted CXXCH cytochrome family protein
LRAQFKFSFFAVLTLLAFSMQFSRPVYAQCNLSQGCGPVDNLTGTPNGTGQVFQGDGASNNGNGGWTTSHAASNQCLSCHNGTDTNTYLLSGHKNTLRKLAPGVLWGGPDGASYATTDSYGSGSVYNWSADTITLGWCDPLFVPAENGLSAPDPTCSYPYYTLPNAQNPVPYATVAPTAAAGGQQNLFYIMGGWDHYGGTANPAATQLGTVFSNGSTGQTYPNGNFDCARCHATGYNFDASAPEPTQNTNGVIAPIPNSQFGRIPSDGFIATGTSGTSSWFLSGVQCERCHQAAWSYGAHGSGPWQATMPQYEAATALCLECHRGENITAANPNTIPPTQGSITPEATPKVQDNGYCSDLSGSAYATCVANSANTWVYKPYFEHEAGATYLNSPHARFTGNLVQNAQHSSNLSVTLSGTYQSQFSESPTDSTKNYGCTGCHDPHQSATPSATLPEPYVCSDCHNLSATITQTINHPSGPGTPFPTGTSADIPGACVTCHMVAADGTVKSHLFRISSANYSTFPTAAQLYGQNITAPNVGSDGVINNAAWNDVDLACGQCHVGGNGIQNPYGLNVQADGRAPAFNKAQLETYASTMHPGDNSASTPTLTPPGGTYTTTQTVTIADATPSVTLYYNTDGTTPPNATSVVYSGTPIPVTANTTIKAIAVGSGGLGSSLVASASYALQTATPTISPAAGTYTTPQAVTFGDVTPGVTYYYTTNGTTPTTASTQYAGPFTLSTQGTATVEVIAVSSFGTSAVTTAYYNFTFPQAATPNFSPGAGSFTAPQTVTISDSTPNATIYYTTNGTTPTTSSAVYGGAITVSSTTTIEAVAVAYGYSLSNARSGTYTILAATPTFSPGAFGTFNPPQAVTISDATTGATIYYTTNGTTPTAASGTVYVGPITLTSTTSFKAIAVLGSSTSAVGSATYTMVPLNPTFSPGAIGTFTGSQAVTIADGTSGTTIYYTTDGSTPPSSPTSTVYTGPVTLTATTKLQAIAVATGMSNSGVTNQTYTFIAATPTFSPGAFGSFNNTVTVSIADTTSGATIYYTTGGSTPTASSPVYTTPLTFTSTTTLKAIAVGGTGVGASSVASGTYTITGSAPALATSQEGVNPVISTNSNSGTDNSNTAGTGVGTSPVASGTYNLVASTPVLSPPAKETFSAPLSVMLSDATPGATIYYTTNGTTPTTASIPYTGPIPVATTTTIKAIAAGKDFGPSSVITETYTLVAAIPAFSPTPKGTFRVPLLVTLTDETPGVTIYYTTNGTTPTTASTPYTKPIRLTSSMTIKAIAAGNGYGASSVVGGIYGHPVQSSKPRTWVQSQPPKVAVVSGK